MTVIPHNHTILKMKITWPKVIFKMHFFFLYILFYSGIRNAYRMDGDLDIRIGKFLNFLVIGFSVWYLGANLFFSYLKFGRGDYLSTKVLVGTLVTIVLLEFFLF